MNKTSAGDPPSWRAFELLVAAIEERMAPKGAIIKSPDRLRDIDSGRLREVDASIRYSVGSVEILVTIECRKRWDVANVTWIEQLATKRSKVGAAKTIAVSAKGFSVTARQSAARYGIELRVLGEIGPEDIDGWFAPAPMVHIARLVESVTCKVILVSGSEIEIEGMDARFRHPQVHGDFPGNAFLSFIEMKNPKAFGDVPIDGAAHKLRFDLNAQDADLIPVPLGAERKSGKLEMLVDNEYVPIQSLTLELLISYKSQRLQPADGRHFVYGSPEAAVSGLSHFESEMFGIPVQIDHFSKQDSAPSATISFPSGLKLPGQLINPRLTDMTTVDIEMLQKMPVTIKIRGGRVADGIFLKPFDVLFKDEISRADFSRRHFMFLLEGDLQRIKQSAKENPESKLFWELVKIFPREAIEYIDLSPSIGVVEKGSVNG